MKNIAIIGNYKQDSANGVYQVIYNIVTSLKKQFHFIILHVSGKKKLEIIRKDGITIVELPFYRKLFPRIETIKFLKNNELGIQLYHFHSVYSISNIIVSKLIRGKYIISPHGGYDPNIFKRSKLKKGLFKFLFENRYLKSAKGLVAINKGEEEDINNFFGGELPVEIIPNSIPRNILDFIESERSLSDQKLMMYLGRLDYLNKGIDLLLEAFAKYAHEETEIKLFLVGPFYKNHQKFIVRLISKLKLKSRVVITRPLYGEEKIKLLKKARLLLYPSRWEVFGLSIIEGMALGIPVLTSDRINLAEEIKRADAAFVASLSVESIYEQMKLAMKNDQLCLERITNAKNFIKSHFDNDLIIRKYAKLYNKMCDA